MAGTLETIPEFHSHYVQTRRVDVWLPESYDARPDHRYPVLYMHDGQNLFDPEHAFLGETWGIPKALTRLATAGEIADVMVVGMWSTAVRWEEYLPQRPFEVPGGIRALNQLDPTRISGLPVSDRYLRFVVEEVKPLIDDLYRTRPGRDQTTIMGSSMGGLVSLYALCEYPAVFGQAGCVSTHWPAVGKLILPYLRAHLPPPGMHRLYFDYGTETLDAEYEPHQMQINALLTEAGYRAGQDWIVRKFEGAAHNEPAWRARVDVPLRFLLGSGA